MDRIIIEALLDRYLKGETSQEENELVENWLEKSNNSHSEWQQFNQNRKNQWLAELLFEIQNSIRATKSKLVFAPATQSFVAAHCGSRSGIGDLFYLIHGVARITKSRESDTVNGIDSSLKSTEANQISGWQ